MRKILKRVAFALALGLLWPVLAYATGQVVTASVQFQATFTETTTAGLQNNEILQQINPGILNYTNGTGSNQVDTCYAAKLTLVASTPQTIDLSTLTDPAGNAVTFARAREFVIQNTATTAGYDVLISQGAANGWVGVPLTGTIPCRYGSVVRISDPVSTGASNGNYSDSTHKTIKFDPGSNGPIVIYLWIIGGSAA